MEFGVIAVGKSCFAVEVGDSALGFDLETVDFDGLAIALAGSAVEKGVCVVEKEGAAVGGGSSPVESGGRAAGAPFGSGTLATRIATLSPWTRLSEKSRRRVCRRARPVLVDFQNRLRHAVMRVWEAHLVRPFPG